MEKDLRKLKKIRRNEVEKISKKIDNLTEEIINGSNHQPNDFISSTLTAIIFLGLFLAPVIVMIMIKK